MIEDLSTSPTPVIKAEIMNTLGAITNDPKINRRTNYYEYREAYKGKGVDLDKEFASRPKTRKVEGVKDKFFHNNEGTLTSSLAEELPLFANLPGRIGAYFDISVSKTAKQDDQGNSFIDLVIEVKNNWISNGAPKELQDVPEKMTFLVDVTTNTDAESFIGKINVLKEVFLLRGKKANVLCYKDSYGNLGIDRPKILIKQNEKMLGVVGTQLGECINMVASDKFIINRPDSFEKLYREYFMDLMTSIAENATANSVYLKSLVPDPKRALLAKEYDKIVRFIEAYKKTPVTKKLAS